MHGDGGGSSKFPQQSPDSPPWRLFHIRDASEARDKSENHRKDVETYGQSGEVMSEPKAEPKEQSSLHLGHSARHLPASQADLL